MLVRGVFFYKFCQTVFNVRVGAGHVEAVSCNVFHTFGVPGFGFLYVGGDESFYHVWGECLHCHFFHAVAVGVFLLPCTSILHETFCVCASRGEQFVKCVKFHV